MHLHLTAFALTVGIFWGGGIFLVALANAIWPGYGQAFLQLMASLYPGYHPVASAREITVATVYGFVDGVISGWLLGWLYVLLSRYFPGRTA